jgi:hypothetical protein
MKWQAALAVALREGLALGGDGRGSGPRYDAEGQALCADVEGLALR